MCDKYKSVKLYASNLGRSLQCKKAFFNLQAYAEMGLKNI